MVLMCKVTEKSADLNNYFKF